MPTFILKSANDFSAPVQLHAEDEHHITKVLRHKIGDRIRLTNNQGQLADAHITCLKPFTLDLIAVFAGETPSPITVCLPMIEKKNLEWCIEKLTELNIASVQCIETARTQNLRFAAKQWQRLQHVAQSAQKQCGRATALVLHPPQPLHTLKFTHPTFFASLTHTAQIAMLQRFPVTLIVGPEGGFTTDEETWLMQAGCHPVSLGQTVLRSETACIALTSLIKFTTKI